MNMLGRKGALGAGLSIAQHGMCCAVAVGPAGWVLVVLWGIWRSAACTFFELVLGSAALPVQGTPLTLHFVQVPRLTCRGL
jgi:hypothetical protein